jgi:hypothetical protein
MTRICLGPLVLIVIGCEDLRAKQCSETSNAGGAVALEILLVSSHFLHGSLSNLVRVCHSWPSKGAGST